MDTSTQEIKKVFKMKDSTQIHKKGPVLLVAAAFFVVFGLVGSMDYQDAVAEAEHYEEMVCNGYWPNYKNIDVNCEH